MEWKFPAKAAAQLQQQVQGTVVVSADAAYHSARQAFVANYQAFPQIIVYCEVFSDAAAALAFARENGNCRQCAGRAGTARPGIRSTTA